MDRDSAPGEEPAGLTITRSTDDGVFRLALAGYIDLSNAHLLGQAVSKALGEGPAVELELSGLTFVDSTGLREFVLGYQQAEQAGRGYRVVGAKGPVRQVLELTGMLDYLSTGVPAAG